MLLRFLGLSGFVDRQIIYDFIYIQEIEEILETGIDFISEVKIKSIDYLFAILQITRNLPSDIRKDIFIRSLISEFQEEIFIRKVNLQLHNILNIPLEEDQSDSIRVIRFSH